MDLEEKENPEEKIDGNEKTDIQIEIPIIPEESLDGLSTIYTIYPK